MSYYLNQFTTLAFFLISFGIRKYYKNRRIVIKLVYNNKKLKIEYKFDEKFNEKFNKIEENWSISFKK